MIESDYIDLLYETYFNGVYDTEGKPVGIAQTPRQSLDETSAGLPADVSGGSPPGTIAWCDLSLNQAVDASGYTTIYAFTFNYNPMTTQTLSVARDMTYLSPDCEEILFWTYAFGKAPKRVITKPMGMFAFSDQYTIFKKHFKTWLKDVNKLVPEAVVGYNMTIEETKVGVLHAHAMIYSRNNYEETVCQTARVLWARITKGKTYAMEKAFEKCSSAKAWQKYITKNFSQKKL